MTETMSARPRWAVFAALIAFGFGIVTIIVGGKTLFGGQAERASAGNIVPFVLWFNFIAGFAYIVAGIALYKLKSCSRRLVSVIAISTTLVFLHFGLHIFNGGAYEMRTVAAMTIRSSLWILIAATVLRTKALKPINCQY